MASASALIASAIHARSWPIRRSDAAASATRSARSVKLNFSDIGMSIYSDKARGSEFIREHDGEHPSGKARVCRVRRSVALTGAIVVIDLPKNELTAEFDRAEVVLDERIVVRRERFEEADALKDIDLLVCQHRSDAERDDDATGG